MQSDYISKRTLDRLVYDYLQTNGFSEAADELKKESKFIGAQTLPLPVKESSLKNKARIEVRDSVFNGDLLNAQKVISKNCANFFDENDDLLFDMRLQQLIEHVRENDIEKALESANSSISTLVNGNEDRLNRVQEVLSLLVDQNSMNQRLVTKIRRLNIWRKINRVTLEDRVKSNEPGSTQSSLESIYQIGCWTERKMLEYDPKFKQNQFKDILSDNILIAKNRNNLKNGAEMETDSSMVQQKKAKKE